MSATKETERTGISDGGLVLSAGQVPSVSVTRGRRYRGDKREREEQPESHDYGDERDGFENRPVWGWVRERLDEGNILTFDIKE